MSETQDIKLEKFEELWSDPLGPLVKVFPAMALALFVAAALEER